MELSKNKIYFCNEIDYGECEFELKKNRQHVTRLSRIEKNHDPKWCSIERVLCWSFYWYFWYKSDISRQNAKEELAKSSAEITGPSVSQLPNHEKFEYEKFCDVVDEEDCQIVLGRFRCTLCGKRFIKETRLQQHMKVGFLRFREILAIFWLQKLLIHQFAPYVSTKAKQFWIFLDFGPVDIPTYYVHITLRTYYIT